MQVNLYEKPVVEARPFLKWAGGKKQLIGEIESRLPEEIKKSGKIDKYFEPFVGGGAIFFHLISNYEINEAYLFDINRELILVYNVIKKNPEKLIFYLEELAGEFLPKSQEDRKEFFLEVRQKFNDAISDFDFDNYSEEHIIRASYTIFMNKTCFNGLFRLNRQGKFNVPCGKYKNPLICDKENIRNVSLVLKNTNIYNASYLDSEELIDDKSLVYLDPPYRPLNETSNFTTYAGNEFGDEEQLELGAYYKRISEKGAKAILSNSDPKNTNPEDNFFDDLYGDFTIERVKANRAINSNAEKRGAINEILVRNY